jgi:ribosome-binding protein aMBF1 (putative translation factor)
MEVSSVEKKFLGKTNIKALLKLIKKKNKEYGSKNIINLLIPIMKETYRAINLKKINRKNVKEIFRQYNKLCINSINEKLSEDSNISNNMKYKRDFNSQPKRVVQVQERPVFEQKSTQHFSHLNRNETLDDIANFYTPIKPNSNNKVVNNYSKDDMKKILEQYEDQRNKDIHVRKKPPTPKFLKTEKTRHGNEVTENKLNVDNYDNSNNFYDLNNNNDNFKPQEVVIDNASLEDRLKRMQESRDNVNIPNDMIQKLPSLVRDNNVPLSNNVPMNQNVPLSNNVPMNKNVPMNQNVPMNHNNVPLSNNVPMNKNVPLSNNVPMNQNVPMNHNNVPMNSNTKPTLVLETSQDYSTLVKENQELKKMVNKVNMMKINNSILNQRENELLKKEVEIKQLLESYVNINNMKNISMNINFNEGKYNFKFDRLDNIVNISLVNYSLPNIRYNITSNNNILQYTINDNMKELVIPKGRYNIELLLEKLKNNDFKLRLDFDERVVISSNNNIELHETNLLKCLGFNKVSGKELKANRIYDLRNTSKVLLYIKNLDNDYPMGVLYNNRTNSSIESYYDNLSLENFEIELRDENNNIYDLNNMECRLNFMLTIDISKVFSST